MNQQNKTEKWEDALSKGLANFDLQNNNGLRTYLDEFISQLLSDARREERERCLEALPKKRVMEDGWDSSYTKNYEVYGFNQAITTVEESIKNLKDK